MNLPSGPKTSQWLQQVQWVTDPIGYMETAQKCYGDIFTTSVIIPKPVVLISNPQALKQVLNDTKYFTAPGELSEAILPLFGNSSVLILNGEKHMRQRRLLMPPFHGARMQAYGQLICNIAEQAMKQQVTGKTFSIRSVMQDISLQVIIEAVFGLHDKERGERFRQVILSLFSDFRAPLAAIALVFPSMQQDLGWWSPWRQFRRVRQKIDELLYAEINERRQHPDPERKDILSLLISARDEDGQAMTDEELCDQLTTLLFAGHDTTATAIAWAFYEIHKHPEIRDKLIQELNSLDDSQDAMSIFRLPYLTAVCNETLRMYPVNMLTTGRMVKSPVNLMGYELNPGTVLFGSIYLTHHREDIYPDPKQFKPERFLEKQFSPHEFLPFGSGTRRCIGEALAQMEMKLVLATVLSRYHLVLANEQPEQPQRRGITLAPGNGVKMVIQSERCQEQLLATTVR
ncbi:cytochrome P450 [Scytonema hofmannii PCC 7110]|uniref:Cytochrome P450 n=1 Tax=Scytonema hofmannii PCC 7110 TaxID=128403 RepID=A0A139WZS1_9CYAN|nr:cytochrome P450 [Scytonema hofmannii]KYC37957.1 cytochrome P450 [Scytonema hofmannii PCC 7110]